MRYLIFFQLVSLSLVLSACSGGGARVAGQQCPRRFDPVPMMSVAPNRKAEVKPANLPVGTYVLTKSLLFFKGDPTPSAPEGFQVLIREETPKKARTADLATTTDCFRNAKVTQSYGAKVDGIAGLVVENGRVTSTIKSYGFVMNEDQSFEIQHGPSDQKPAQPSDVFAKAEEAFVLGLGPNDIEIRSRGRGVNGTYYLSTFLHRAN